MVESIAFFIEQTSIGLYIFVGIGLVWYIRKWLMAGYAYRATNFELERDYARDQRSGALFAVVLFLEIGLIVAGVENVVVPTIREDREVVAAIQAIEADDEEDQGPIDDGVFATSTPPAEVRPPSIDASGVELGDDDQLAVFVTPTLTPTPVGTIEPNAPDVVGCDTPNATLQIPANGMRVFQVVPVRGTAYAEDFSEYKLEISGPQTLNNFLVVASDTFPAEELTTLSQFNPDPYEPGTYLFRLTVFDSAQTLVAACQVTIYLSRPIPTATPLSGS